MCKCSYLKGIISLCLFTMLMCGVLVNTHTVSAAKVVKPSISVSEKQYVVGQGAKIKLSDLIGVKKGTYALSKSNIYLTGFCSIKNLPKLDYKLIFDKRCGVTDITYTVYDAKGNSVKKKISVFTTDLKKCISGLSTLKVNKNSKNINYLKGLSWSSLNVRKVSVKSSNVNLKKKGMYKVTYTVYGKYGGTAVVSRSVKVV